MDVKWDKTENALTLKVKEAPLGVPFQFVTDLATQIWSMKVPAAGAVHPDDGDVSYNIVRFYDDGSAYTYDSSDPYKNDVVILIDYEMILKGYK